MNFIKTFLAALLAFVVANVVLGILSVMVFAGLFASLATTATTVRPSGSTLRIDFTNRVTDQPDNTIFLSRGIGGMEINSSNSLWQVLGAIDRAADDPAIEMLYINITGGSISLANLEEVRAAVERFKERSGKRVVAYSEVYSQSGYYLASVADEVWVHPEGGVGWRGLAGQALFYKGLLDKLGVEVEVVRHGDFKSAVEPFVQESMSDQSRMQMERLLGSVWMTMREDIGRSRGIDPQRLSEYAAGLAVGSAGDAVRLGLVDSLMYEDQVREKVGAVVELGDYIASMPAGRMSAARIAVVYVDGDIVDGASEPGSAGSATVSEKLADARKDDRVKGVVVRINSPGGSAQAAEVMWREMELLRKEKPVVVSMGSYAASGGYYVACPADMILADRSTVTGSIGVFGLIPNVGDALREKVGVAVDMVATEPHAGLGSPMRAMDDAEREYMQKSVERVYRTFVGHVAAGRNMTVEAVDAVSGGRVWSGADAVGIGLADGVGGLAAAVEICADRAGVAGSYKVVEAVDGLDTFASLMRSLFGARAAGGVMGDLGVLSEAFAHYRDMSALLRQNTIQARAPFELSFGE